MTDKTESDDSFAYDDHDTDLTSIWDETDDDGTLLPDTSAEDGSNEDEEDQDDDDEGNINGDDEDDNADEGESDDGEDNDESGEVDYKALYEKAQQEIKTTVGRLKAAEARGTQLPSAKSEAAPIPVTKPEFTEEEQAMLDAFRNTYSDEVVKVIDLLTSHKASQIVDSTIQSRLAPVEQVTQEMVAQAHFAAIESVHPDLQEVDASPIFESWIQSRPEHLRATYESIRSHGTPAQVIAMVTEFKDAVGYNKKSSKQGPSKQQKSIPATAVKRQRGTVPVQPKKSTSDLAALWDEIEV